jgi:hypothetical protein
LRSALAELVALGFVSPSGKKDSDGNSRWVIPDELREALSLAIPANLKPQELLTLHGFLEQHFRSQGEGEGAKDSARRMYKFLGSEAALCGRIDDLNPEFRDLVSWAITHWGGLVPLSELSAKGIQGPKLLKLRQTLEEDTLGTIADFDLEHFGIRQRGSILAIFNEAVLAWLRREATGESVTPHTIASIGVDFVSNFSRFASFVGDENIRFTVRGAIFKSTGKRIAEHLIPNPGSEFRRREILELEYRFALAYRLIDRTGERSFLMTPEGKEFLSKDLHEKQVMMLDWLIEDRELPGDMAHQLPLRRTALRYIKRMEPEKWHAAMFLPFVARNHYLVEQAINKEGQMDDATFPVRSSADIQSLAWNLLTWIRKHLYVLGIVDMGYDKSGRASAIRLTKLGAELLEMIPGRQLEGAGHIVVNPDFEVVLFPDERSHELVYELDRFCDRELSDSLYHYRISPGSIHRGLQQGLDLDSMMDLLVKLSRTPIPRNVLFSLESWARMDGLVTYHPDGRLICETPEILDRLELHPKLEQLGLKRLDHSTLTVSTSVDEEQLQSWVRDFGVSFRSTS